MTRKIQIFKPNGIETQPVTRGDWQAPFDMRNIDIDVETGHLTLRQGYVTDDKEVIGSRQNAKLFGVNYIGDAETQPYSRLYAIHPEEYYAHIGHRVFTSGIGSPNRWFDAETGVAYKWEVEVPTGSIAPNYPPRSIILPKF